MAIDLYFGNQGTGKTYQVVTVAIKEAINQGRRVCTNIRGINRDAIVEFLKVENKDDGRSYGEVVIFENSQEKEPDFYPTEKDYKTTFLKGGDLYVVDEAYKLYKKGVQYTRGALDFFREHRHFVNEQGLTTEIIALTQLKTDLHPELFGTIDYSYNSIDLKDLGIEDKFTIHVYKGVPVYRDKPIREILLQPYDKNKFHWYKSHAAENAKQVKVDKRNNIWGSWYFRFMIFGTPLLLIIGIYGVYDYFSSNMQPKAKKPSLATNQVNSLPVSTNQNLVLQSPAAQNPVPVTPENKEWFVVGFTSIGKKNIVLLTDGTHTRTLIDPEIKFTGRTIEVKENDKWLNNSSVPSASGSAAIMPKLN